MTWGLAGLCNGPCLFVSGQRDATTDEHLEMISIASPAFIRACVALPQDNMSVVLRRGLSAFLHSLFNLEVYGKPVCLTRCVDLHPKCT